MIFIKIILLFFIAFDPQVPFLPNGVGFSFLSLCFLLIGGVMKLKHPDTNQVLLLSKPYFLLFFFCAVFITLRLILNGGVNFVFYLSFFRAFVTFSSIVLWIIVFNEDFKKNNFIYYIAIIYVFNAVINFLAGTFPNVLGFLEVFRGVSISNELGGNPYRNSYIAGAGYYSIGTAYGLIALLISFYIVRGEIKGYAYPLILGIVSISGFIAARTSFFAVAPALLYLIQARPIYSVYFTVIFFFLLNLVIMLPLLNPYLDWMMLFFDLENNSSASHLLSKMYFWPGTDVFFYGKGIINDGSNAYTDGGYMQDIIFGGVFFLLLKLYFLGVFTFSYLRTYPLFTLFVTFSVLLFHFKGLFLYNNAQGMAAFYFIYFYLGRLKNSEGVKCRS
ncbi:hypothetical protein [Colwellia sp. TT2012]|uniref:hypothetical protein n=1 Tax=Colwellia sp. TT2012 TaxID=1720342 RepID=UPI000710EC0A|nr:hypothetical protein [Colwellia sp. TT2012]